MEFNKILHSKRKLANLTQEQLAEKLFVSSKTISNWETGKTTPDISTVIHIADFFHMSLNEFFLEDSNIVKKIDKDLKLKTLYKWLLFIIVSLSILGCIFFNKYQYKNELIDRFNPFMKMEIGYATLPEEVTYNSGKSYNKLEAEKEDDKNRVPQIPDPYQNIPVFDDPFGSSTLLNFLGGQSPKGRNYAIIQHKGLYVKKISFISWESIPKIYRDNMSKNYEEYPFSD